MPASPEVMEVARLDELSPSDAADALLPCCASRRWTAELLNGRPHSSLARLRAASDAALAALEWADVAEALAAHPRISAQAGPAGQPAQPGQIGRTGQVGQSGQVGQAALAGRGEREASWSAQEQQGTATLDPAAREQLRAANAAYERRFGYVFLICATGKSAGQLRDALQQRLGHDAGAEREVVRAELREIVALRLAKAFR